jgi:hypothetical protein
MGVINIKAKRPSTIVPVDEAVETNSEVINQCSSTWIVEVVEPGGCWTEFIIDNSFVIRTDGSPFVNGEQVPQGTQYTIGSIGWKSTNEFQNNQENSCSMKIRESDGGILLEQLNFDRFHTGDIC